MPGFRGRHHARQRQQKYSTTRTTRFRTLTSPGARLFRLVVVAGIGRLYRPHAVPLYGADIRHNAARLVDLAQEVTRPCNRKRGRGVRSRVRPIGLRACGSRIGAASAAGASTALAVHAVTLENLAQHLLLDYRMNGRRSIDSVEQSFEHLRAFFGDVDVREITYHRIVEYVSARLAKGRARATVRKELAALKRAFRLARREDPLIVPPAFPEIRVQNARKGFIDGPRFERLRQAAQPHLRPLLLFLFLTGWRISEARALRWEQVDLEAGVVRIEPGESKNGDGRDFPFRDLPELEKMLRDQREWVSRIEWNLSIPEIPWVFCYPDGRPFKDFRDAWKSALERAGLDAGLWIHDFRRSAVRNFERAKVRRQTAMKLTGHRTEEVYRRYAISDYSDLADAAKAIGALRRADLRAAQQELPFATNGANQRVDNGSRTSVSTTPGVEKSRPA